MSKLTKTQIKEAAKEYNDILLSSIMTSLKLVRSNFIPDGKTVYDPSGWYELGEETYIFRFKGYLDFNLTGHYGDKSSANAISKAVKKATGKSIESFKQNVWTERDSKGFRRDDDYDYCWDPNEKIEILIGFPTEFMSMDEAVKIFKAFEKDPYIKSYMC